MISRLHIVSRSHIVSIYVKQTFFFKFTDVYKIVLKKLINSSTKIIYLHEQHGIHLLLFQISQESIFLPYKSFQGQTSTVKALLGHDFEHK